MLTQARDLRDADTLTVLVAAEDDRLMRQGLMPRPVEPVVIARREPVRGEAFLRFVTWGSLVLFGVLALMAVGRVAVWAARHWGVI